MKGIAVIILLIIASYFLFFKNDRLPKECNEMIVELASLADVMKQDSEFASGLRSGLLKDKADNFKDISNDDFLAKVSANVMKDYKKNPEQTIKKCSQVRDLYKMMKVLPNFSK